MAAIDYLNLFILYSLLAKTQKKAENSYLFQVTTTTHVNTNYRRGKNVKLREEKEGRGLITKESERKAGNKRGLYQ